jgi:hypothetical protein
MNPYPYTSGVHRGGGGGAATPNHRTTSSSNTALYGFGMTPSSPSISMGSSSGSVSTAPPASLNSAASITRDDNNAASAAHRKQGSSTSSGSGNSSSGGSRSVIFSRQLYWRSLAALFWILVFAMPLFLTLQVLFSCGMTWEGVGWMGGSGMMMMLLTNIHFRRIVSFSWLPPFFSSSFLVVSLMEWLFLGAMWMRCIPALCVSSFSFGSAAQHALIS